MPVNPRTTRQARNPLPRHLGANPLPTTFDTLDRQPLEAGAATAWRAVRLNTAGFTMQCCQLDQDARGGGRSTTASLPGELRNGRPAFRLYRLRGGSFEPPGIFSLVHFEIGIIHQHNVTLRSKVLF